MFASRRWGFVLLIGFLTQCAQTNMPEHAKSSQEPILTLSRQGKAMLPIILPDQTIPAEDTAAKELQDYLGKITGCTFTVLRESKADSQPGIHLGATKLALREQLVPDGPESWRIKTVDGSLVLTGGRPRGTLYAVYHFLEDHLGVNWWTPWDEDVPSTPELRLGMIDSRGTPAFLERNLIPEKDVRSLRFAVRRRVNGWYSHISSKYGGGYVYGPPYPCHTFAHYIPPKKYAKTHPDFYPLAEGKRQTHRLHAQLYLLNPKLQSFVADKMKDLIASSRQDAEKNGLPYPILYDFSSNDANVRYADHSPDTLKLVEKEGRSGELITAVNAIAEIVGKTYDEVLVHTLAYIHTAEPPATVRPARNVAVRYAPIYKNFNAPINHPHNRFSNKQLRKWADITDHFYIWHYNTGVRLRSGMPDTTAADNPETFRYYKQQGAEGVLVENEWLIIQHMRDLNLWVTSKLLEDPMQDGDALIRKFTDGYYGPAGTFIREYLDVLSKAYYANPSYMTINAQPRDARYLNVDTLLRLHAIFDRAEQAVAGNPELLRRVGIARIGLDRATVYRWRWLERELKNAGQGMERLEPLDRQAIAERAAQRMRQAIGDRHDSTETLQDVRDAGFDFAGKLNHTRARIEGEVFPEHLMEFAKRDIRPGPVPEPLKNVPPADLYAYTADDFRESWRPWNPKPFELVRDSDSPTGWCSRITFDGPPKNIYKLTQDEPFAFGAYVLTDYSIEGIDRVRRTIYPRDIPGPGYHLYKLADVEIPASAYLYFSRSWAWQIVTDLLSDPSRPPRTFDIYLSVKFDGPDYPHGNPDVANQICIDRVFAVVKH